MTKQSEKSAGRPKRKPVHSSIHSDVSADARALTKDALKALSEIMSDINASPASRVAAAKELLSRGWGSPVQHFEAQDGRVIRSVSDLTDEELKAIKGDG